MIIWLWVDVGKSVDGMMILFSSAFRFTLSCFFCICSVFGYSVDYVSDGLLVCDTKEMVV